MVEMISATDLENHLNILNKATENLCSDNEKMIIGCLTSVIIIEKILEKYGKYCNNCGKCCKTEPIEIVNYELARITSRLNISKTKYKKKYVTSKHYYGVKVNTIKKPCPHLKNNLCEIYDIRPLVCKLYPLCKFNIEHPEISCIDICAISRKILKDYSKNIFMLDEEKNELLKAFNVKPPKGTHNSVLVNIFRLSKLVFDDVKTPHDLLNKIDDLLDEKFKVGPK